MDRPILFNSEMVRAVLDGRKKQTRRIINPQPTLMDNAGQPVILKDPKRKWQVGDKLWVRESTRTICYVRGDEFAYGEFCIEYLADKQLVSCPEERHEWWRHNWHIRPSTTLPSIFMPRWASRITLEITGIGVERVQEITTKGARLEGVSVDAVTTSTMGLYRENFKSLWDSINKKRGHGWDKNDYVWVVEFEVIT